MNKKIIISIIASSLLFVAFFIWEQRQANIEWAELFSKLIVHLGFPAMVGIAVLYFTGIMKKLSEVKDSNAEIKQDIAFNEGLQYFLQKDYKTAFSIWEKLAKNGNMKAQFAIAVMRDKGEGVSKNYDEAFKWYSKAAKQGHAQAQYFLAYMYIEGVNFPQDLIKAYIWASISKTNGYNNAEHFLNAIQGEITPEQIAEAKEMAKRCIESDYEDCGEE